MLKPGQVPQEVISELLAALNGCDCDECASVAIAAAINAWPGNRTDTEYFNHRRDRWEPSIILPLPQEAGDE